MLTIGEVATRAGVATSALRFYEERGLLSSTRTEGNQRRYPRSAIRVVSVIRAAQTLGLSLSEIQETLASLPEGRTPTTNDWSRLSQGWRGRLDEQIASLEALRDQLDDCIGCGCLSLKACGIANWGDVAAEKGSGARYLMGDTRPGG
jgi:MerR family redox-sensitive transcriptional activator SoxR